jgi:hypothetical protein
MSKKNPGCIENEDLRKAAAAGVGVTAGVASLGLAALASSVLFGGPVVICITAVCLGHTIHGAVHTAKAVYRDLTPPK